MYEHKTQKILPPKKFYQRILNNILIAVGVLCVCLIIGITGFHYTASATWIDSLHNSAMLLSGMGPVIVINNAGGKIFSSAYALFSGVVFITNIGIILAPALHRIFHRLHLEEDATS